MTVNVIEGFRDPNDFNGSSNTLIVDGVQVSAKTTPFSHSTSTQWGNAGQSALQTASCILWAVLKHPGRTRTLTQPFAEKVVFNWPGWTDFVSRMDVEEWAAIEEAAMMRQAKIDAAEKRKREVEAEKEKLKAEREQLEANRQHEKELIAMGEEAERKRTAALYAQDARP